MLSFLFSLKLIKTCLLRRSTELVSHCGWSYTVRHHRVLHKTALPSERLIKDQSAGEYQTETIKGKVKEFLPCTSRRVRLSLALAWLRRWLCSSLTPTDCAGFVTPEKKCKAKASKRQRSRRKRTSHSDTDDSDEDEEHSRHRKLIKTEQQMTSQPVSSSSVGFWPR